MREILEDFKKMYTNALDKNTKDYYGVTPLHYAASPCGFLNFCDFIINIVVEKKINYDPSFCC